MLEFIKKFNTSKPNPWKGFVVGVFGSVAGLVAMGYYWKIVVKLRGNDPRQESVDPNGPHELDDISLIGKHYEKGEPSTVAIGQIFYQLFAGKKAESKETKTTLSNVVHYGYGMMVGGLYGVTRETTKVGDIPGGLGWGTGLWLFGSELAIPMLGLSAGPTTQSAASHVYGLGAHFVYGLATSFTTDLLDRVL